MMDGWPANGTLAVLYVVWPSVAASRDKLMYLSKWSAAILRINAATSEIEVRPVQAHKTVRIDGMISPQREYVTAREAAELTGKGEHTIRRMIKDGRLAARKVAANRFEINRADLPGAKLTDTERLAAHLRGVQEFLTAYFGLTGYEINAETAYIALQSKSGRLSPVRRQAPTLYTLPTSDGQHGAEDSQPWPASDRGRAKRVAQAIGKSHLTVREWPTREWNTKEDCERWLLENKGIRVVL